MAVYASPAAMNPVFVIQPSPLIGLHCFVCNPQSSSQRGGGGGG